MERGVLRLLSSGVGAGRVTRMGTLLHAARGTRVAMPGGGQCSGKVGRAKDTLGGLLLLAQGAAPMPPRGTATTGMHLAAARLRLVERLPTLAALSLLTAARRGMTASVVRSAHPPRARGAKGHSRRYRQRRSRDLRHVCFVNVCHWHSTRRYCCYSTL